MRREEGRRVGGGPEGRRVPLPWVARSRLIYGFIPKIEELVDRSKDKIGTDVAYRKIIAMGYRGRSGRPSRPSRSCRMPGGLGGGGTSSYDFIGASVSRTVTMNGHFKFHYDENLRRIGMGRGFVPTNWKEVP